MMLDSQCHANGVHDLFKKMGRDPVPEKCCTVQLHGGALSWQAAVLWRCADCFQHGIIRAESLYARLLASLLGATVHQVKLFEESQGLIRMMQASRCLQEDGSAHVKRVRAAFCYHPNDGDPPLDHDAWDLLLLFKLRIALGLDTEVGPYARLHMHVTFIDSHHDVCMYWV